MGISWSLAFLIGVMFAVIKLHYIIFNLFENHLTSFDSFREYSLRIIINVTQFKIFIV
jgi:hypothetical protein